MKDKLFEDFKKFAKERYGFEVTKREIPEENAFERLFGISPEEIDACLESMEKFEYEIPEGRPYYEEELE